MLTEADWSETLPSQRKLDWVFSHLPLEKLGRFTSLTKEQSTD